MRITLFIPVSEFKGENFLNRSENTLWYTDNIFLDALDGIVSGVKQG